MRFPVLIHKDDDSDYGVTIPDLPGCFSAGETFDEALENAVEAAECHIEGMLIDKEPPPKARSIEYHLNNLEEEEEGVWSVIDVDLSKLSGESKRVNISLPARLLNLIDDYAAKSSETRSGLLVQAALEYIALQEENFAVEENIRREPAAPKKSAKKKVAPKDKKKTAAKKKTSKKQPVPS